MKNTAKVFSQEIINTRYLFISSLIAFLYISFIVILLNQRLVSEVFFGTYPIVLKLTLFAALLQGIFTAFSGFDAVFIILTAILMGANISLLIVTAKKIQGQGRLKMFVGGGGLLGIISTGCTGCGLSVLSLLGFGTGLSFLPFGNNSLYFVSMGALFFSIFYMSRKLAISNSCLINKKKGGKYETRKTL